MTARVGVAGLLIAFLFGVAPAAAAPLKPCRDDRSARCGTIRVPVHRSDPGGPKLKIRFRVYRHRDRSRPALEPIVAVEGGPGYGSIDSADGFRLMLRPLLARRDLILMDNRGTGRSGAIDCPRLQAYRGSYVREVGRCGRKLGRRSDAYGSGPERDGQDPRAPRRARCAAADAGAVVPAGRWRRRSRNPGRTIRVAG